MEIKIKNFAKIKEADIILDGITVIAGENNTGKSTIGKIVFSLFNSISNIDEKIFKERLNEIESTNRIIVTSMIAKMGLSRVMMSRSALGIPKQINVRIKRELRKREVIPDEVLIHLIERILKNWWRAVMKDDSEGMNELAYFVNKLFVNTKEILNIPEEEIVLEIVSRYFNAVFHSQIKPLSLNAKGKTELYLNFNEKKTKFVFEDNFCEECMNSTKMFNKAIYIENPFIIDALPKGRYVEVNPMNEMLMSLLTKKTQEDIMDGVIESVRVKDKLNDIYAMLKSVVDGEILIKRNNEEYYLENREFEKPILLSNLSTGMKSFVIIKMLLEKGCLNENDVVILDEPEIHLHPQWQMIYAELIVLLQKQFQLSIVVTTHSPYFLDALNLFSHKNGIDDKVNFYLSKNIGEGIKMEKVTDKIDLIYKKMALPIQKLDTLRYELNHQ